MKLFYTDMSPYSRKVRVVARERKLMGDIEEIYAFPLDDPPGLIAANPLGKIPALEIEPSNCLFDSPVIAEYLDSCGDQPHLLPKSGSARLTALRWQALADGIMDATVAIRIETLLHEAACQSPKLMDRQMRAIRAAVDYAETHFATLPEAYGLAQIALGAALGYLDFRLPDLPWREHAPCLETWWSETASRPAFLETEPGV